MCLKTRQRTGNYKKTSLKNHSCNCEYLFNRDRFINNQLIIFLVGHIYIGRRGRKTGRLVREHQLQRMVVPEALQGWIQTTGTV